MSLQEITMKLIFLLVFISNAAAISDEKRLLRELLKNYRDGGDESHPLLGRPVVYGNNPVEVQLGLSLIQVFELDNEEQTLDLSVWVKLFWKDEYLLWQPNEFGKVKRVYIPPRHVWTPDILLFNAVKQIKDIYEEDEMHVVVDSNGMATYIRPHRFTLNCPHEKDDSIITCKLKFGSWVFTEALLNLTASDDRMDLGFYTQHNKYEIYSTKAERHSKEYACCKGDKYDDITYSLQLKKKRPRYAAVQTDAAVKTNCQLLLVVLPAILLLFV